MENLLMLLVLMVAFGLMIRFSYCVQIKPPDNNDFAAEHDPKINRDPFCIFIHWLDAYCEKHSVQRFCQFFRKWLAKEK